MTHSLDVATLDVAIAKLLSPLALLLLFCSLLFSFFSSSRRLFSKWRWIYVVTSCIFMIWRCVQTRWNGVVNTWQVGCTGWSGNASWRSVEDRRNSSDWWRWTGANSVDCHETTLPSWRGTHDLQTWSGPASTCCSAPQTAPTGPEAETGRYFTPNYDVTTITSYSTTT